MKRTITMRVEVNDDAEYADVIAQIVQHPRVIAWHATRVFPGVVGRLRKRHQIETLASPEGGTKTVLKNSA